jgi:putative endopeptidase
MTTPRCAYLLAALAATLVLPGIGRAQDETPIRLFRGLELEGMDRSVAPLEDFDRFANGRWYAANPIPANQRAWGVGTMLRQQNLRTLREILEEAAADSHAARGSNRQKVGDFYATAMDTAAIEKQGLSALDPELDRIAALQRPEQIPATLGWLRRRGTAAALRPAAQSNFKDSTQIILWLAEGGLGLPDRDYYFSDAPRMVGIRKEYLAHVGRMLALGGDSTADAAARAEGVLAFETRLARATRNNVERRDPAKNDNPMSAEQLDALTPGVRWSAYLRELGLKPPAKMNVTNPAFMREIGKMIGDTSIEGWRTYLRWRLLDTWAHALPQRFVDEDFSFTGRVLAGTQQPLPRWQRAAQWTDANLGEALGQLYVAKAFRPQAKARMQALVANLIAVLRDRIKTLDWMSEPTRQEALRKVDRLTVKVGYPERWRDYSRLKVDRRSLMGNLRRAATFNFQFELDRIGKPINPDEWRMTPPTVNAYSNSSHVEVVFPAGFLQPPAFDPEAEDVVNYARIGSVIGHELTHQFDDRGRQFDSQGNLRDWWKPEDAATYRSRAELVEKQYGAYAPFEDLRLNGKLTLGENIADIGGLKLAWLAWQRSLQGKPKPAVVNGFTPEQRFFIAYAQLWRTQMRPEAVRLQVTTDPHSPSHFRIIGPLSVTPEFYAAFAGDQPGSRTFPPGIW